MNKGKKTGKAVMVLGILCILAALGLAVFNVFTENKAGKASADVLEKLDMDSITSTVPDEFSKPDYVINPDMLMRKKLIDGKAYVGKITVPALDIELPVMAECSKENLKTAPCIYEGTPYKNNLIVAGHNYRSHFGSLRLTEGDTVIFKDMDGNEFRYEVMYTEIIDESDKQSMSAGEWDLTLFTCTYSRTTRITVRCKMI